MNTSSLTASQAQDTTDGIEVGAALAIAAHQRAATASDGTISCRCDRYQAMTVDEHKRHLINAVSIEITRQVESRLSLTADIESDA